MVHPAGDANETAAAWAVAIERGDGPVALALTARSCRRWPARTGWRATASRAAAMSCARRPGGRPQLLMIGTGSELQLAFAAAEALEAEGIPTRVVSLPCWELFDLQDQAYRDEVLPPDVRARVSVEIGVSLGWERWVGDAGAIIGLDHFGASAPAGTIFEHFGFTTERVTDVGRRVVREACAAASRPSTAAISATTRRLAVGEAGVARTDGSDPGHS